MITPQLMRRTVGLPLLGVGCFMLLIGVSLYNRQRQSLSWPSTTGTVESARILVIHCDKSSSRSPVILYMYTVAGVEYRSDRVGTTSKEPGEETHWLSRCRC